MAVNLLTKTKPTLAGKAVNGHDPGANQAHWMVEDTATNKETKTEFDTITDHTFSLFQVYTRWHGWTDFEDDDGSGTTSGTFDFSIIRRELDYCEERGIPYMIRVDNRSFVGDPQGDWSSAGVAYAVDDMVEYLGWAYVCISAHTSDAGKPPSGTRAANTWWRFANKMPGDLVTAGYQIDTPGGGKTAVITLPTSRERWENLCTAIIDEFKDRKYFAGIQAPGETAGQNTCDAGAYVGASAEIQWNTMLKTIANHCDYVYCCFGINFQTHIGGGSTDNQIQTTWNNTVADVPTPNVIFFVPDILLPGSPDHWTALNERLYKILNASYYSGHATNTETGIACDVQNYRLAGSMQYDSHRWHQSSGNQYYREKGDPTFYGGENDLNSDGHLDQHEQFIWMREYLNLDLVFWSRINFPQSDSPTFMYTFDRTTGGAPFGSTYGDDVGVAMQGWADDHNPLYRDGPAGGAASAVVEQFDEFGQSTGYGPAPTPAGVFFGRTDIPFGRMWRVTSVSVAGVTVTPLEGGAYSIAIDPGVAPGTYSFDWELIGGPAPSTGTKNFEVT